MRLIENAYRWLIFKIGDLRWCGWKHFPFLLTWDAITPEIRGDEVLKAISIAKPGDVLVTRHEGYVDNKFIGGAMVHAAICVGADNIVEAVSDDAGGVRRCHMIDALQADKAILLRPKHLREEEVTEALNWAAQIIGCKYDIYFDFNTEEEQAVFKNVPLKAKYRVTFCCTEVPHFCYLNQRDKLQLYREHNLRPLSKFLRTIGFPIGKELLTADQYAEAEFEIVWASRGATVEWFRLKGASEKVLRRMELYWCGPSVRSAD